MKDTQWNITPNQPKAIMLAKRQLAEPDICRRTRDYYRVCLKKGSLSLTS